MEKYHRLGRPQRSLAFKGWWLRERPLEGDPIPFTRLLRNRVPYQIRSYSSARFHATGMTGATLEYRWPAWIQNRPEGSGIDAYVFGDLGQPFDHTHEIAMANLLWSAGFGLRFRLTEKNRMNYRADIAWGRDGYEWYVSLTEAF